MKNNSDLFTFNKAQSMLRSPHMPTVALSERKKLVLVRVLHDTPGAHEVEIVASSGMNKVRWLDKRHTQLAGDHIFVEGWIATAEGL